MKVPHGLSAAPDMLIVKGLETTNDWSVLHKDGSNGDFLQLNGSSAQSGAGSIFGSTFTRPTATVFTVGNTGETGTADKQYIAYCFHSVTGYSKIGTYEGNGSARSITGLGFQPDFLIIKDADSTEQWYVFDSRRGHSKFSHPNLSNNEGTDATARLTAFGSDGFSLGTDGAVNGNGNTYVYAAFKKNVASNTTLANSFKTVTYSGNASTQSITGVGFKPDLVWIKTRNAVGQNSLFDSVRGNLNRLNSATTAAASNVASTLISFDTDGFTFGNESGNNNNETNVAWCWKAGNTWQSNIDGATPSTVNANTANGFSIVKWVGTANSQTTVGHGLSSTPELIITKNLDTAANDGWPVFTTSIGNDHTLFLNSTSAKSSSSGTWGSTSPTSSVFTVQDNASNNQSGNEIIAYCWHSVSGYSKIGTYTGNSSTGHSITGLGFQPNFVMIKRVDSNCSNSAFWFMFDSVRGAQYYLRANGNNAESAAADATLTSFDSDGFTVGNDGCLNTGTMIYMAFKAN